MSIHKFCHNCGKPVQPDWRGCPFCQTDLASLASTPRPVVQQPGHVPTFEPFIARGQDEDEDSYIDRIPHLQLRQNALQIEINAPVVRPETFGATIIAGASEPPHPSETYKRDALDPTKALEEFKRESSTLRNERQSTEIRVKSD